MSKGRWKHRKEVCVESVWELLRQRLSVAQIAKRLQVSPQTVHRRISEERERIDYIDSLCPVREKEKFRVELTLKFGSDSHTVVDVTATQGILAGN